MIHNVPDGFAALRRLDVAIRPTETVHRKEQLATIINKIQLTNVDLFTFTFAKRRILPSKAYQEVLHVRRMEDDRIP